MGKKNCELTETDIARTTNAFLEFEESPQSKIFNNAAFGYWKIVVERPLRLHSQLSLKAINTLRYASGDEDIRAALHEKLGETLLEKPASVRAQLEQLLNDWGNEDTDGEDEESSKKGLPENKKKKLLTESTWTHDATLHKTALLLRKELGDKLFEDHNTFRDQIENALKKLELKLSATDLKQILKAVSWRVETAPPVIAKIHKLDKAEANPLYGRYEVKLHGKNAIVEYETDTDLRDTEQISFLEAPESGTLGGIPTESTSKQGIESFFKREVLPYTQDAWIKEDATKIGYEISFTRHFYQPKPLRSLSEIRADIMAIEQETDGLLNELLELGEVRA